MELPDFGTFSIKSTSRSTIGRSVNPLRIVNLGRELLLVNSINSEVMSSMKLNPLYSNSCAIVLNKYIRNITYFNSSNGNCGTLLDYLLGLFTSKVDETKSSQKNDKIGFDLLVLN